VSGKLVNAGAGEYIFISDLLNPVD